MTAQHKFRRRWRTDWFRILVDMQARGWPNARVAESIGVPESTLRGWKAGSEPQHCDGQRLLILWCAVAEQDYDHRPMTDE